MSCIRSTDCIGTEVNVNNRRGNTLVEATQGNVTRDTQLRFRLLKVVTQHFVQHEVPMTSEIKNIIVEIVMIVLKLKSKNTSYSSIETELETIMESIPTVQQPHNMKNNVNSFKEYVNEEIKILQNELNMLKMLLRSPPRAGRNNSWTSSTSSWSSVGEGPMNTEAINDRIAVINSMIAAFNDQSKSVDVYVSLVKAAKAIVSKCMYTFVGNPGGYSAASGEELRDEFKICLVSENEDITQHIRTVLAETKKQLDGEGEGAAFAANLLNGIITAEITYNSSETQAAAKERAQAAAIAQARRAAEERAQAAAIAHAQVERMKKTHFNNLGKIPGVKSWFNHEFMRTNIENPLFEEDITMTSPSGHHKDSFKVIYQFASNAEGGGKSTKVKVLGRTRKVIKEGRRKFVMVKGVKMALVDARKAEKEIARAKKN
jgi:hypothetical protein